MVTEFGFSEKLGPLRYTDNQEEVFLGHSVTQHKAVSDATAEQIDAEIRQLIDTAEAEARRILSEHGDDLEALAQGLLEYETLSGDEVRALLAGEPIIRPGSEDDSKPGDGGRRSSVPTAGSRGKERGSGIGPEPLPEG